MGVTLDSLLALIPTWTASLGVVGLVSYQLFKHFAAKRLDSKFEAKTIKLKSKHDVLLAELKAAQGRSLRHVQSYIDREIHLAKKLADREFDVLSEGWTLLVKAFDAAQTTGSEWVPTSVSGVILPVRTAAGKPLTSTAAT